MLFRRPPGLLAESRAIAVPFVGAAASEALGRREIEFGLGLPAGALQFGENAFGRAQHGARTLRGHVLEELDPKPRAPVALDRAGLADARNATTSRYNPKLSLDLIGHFPSPCPVKPPIGAQT